MTIMLTSYRQQYGTRFLQNHITHYTRRNNEDIKQYFLSVQDTKIGSEGSFKMGNVTFSQEILTQRLAIAILCLSIFLLWLSINIFFQELQCKSSTVLHHMILATIKKKVMSIIYNIEKEMFKICEETQFSCYHDKKYVSIE